MDDVAEVRRIVDAATREDGREPLNEAALLHLARGLDDTALLVRGGGFAWVHDGQLDLVVEPARRRHGVGRALLDEVPSGTLDAWSHVNHPGAARLAEETGWQRVRDLWLMRRSLRGPVPDASVPESGDGAVIRTFLPGDEDQLMAVNATAFAHHPEQGALTRADLDERMASSWFDPHGLFMAVSPDGELLGFHWTKVHAGDPAYGEVYVVGVSPKAQGRGLGAVLTAYGLRYLKERGLGEVVLYVEADNRPALKIYGRLGFTHADADTDVMYHRP